MRRPGWVVVILAALVSALIAGVATTMVLTSDADRAVAPEMAEGGGEPVAATKARVARLERENGELRERRERPRVTVPRRQRPDGDGQTTGGVPAGWKQYGWPDQALPSRGNRTFFVSQTGDITPRSTLLHALSGSPALRARVGEALDAGGAAAISVLLEIVRDPELSLPARTQAVAEMLNVSPKSVGTIVDEVLWSSNAEAGLRVQALQSAAVAAATGHGVPESVRSLAFDLGAQAAERETARSVMVQGAPDEMLPYVEQWAASADAGDRQRAKTLTQGIRHRSYLPVLTRMVNDERYRAMVNDLIGTIAPLKDRSWSAAQMTGQPDTPIGGDLGTAWASKTPQMGRVWIELRFDEAVTPSQVRVRETLAPGAVARIAVRDGSEWVTLWEGEATKEAAPRWFAPSLDAFDGTTREVRIELETERAEGWNEIDAVELIGAGGLRQWAESVRASTSYAGDR